VVGGEGPQRTRAPEGCASALVLYSAPAAHARRRLPRQTLSQPPAPQAGL